MATVHETSLIPGTAKQVRAKFKDLLAKTNKERPRPQDVKALSELLYGHKSLELWRTVSSAGAMAEIVVVENASAVPGVKECWKHRLQQLKKDLGCDEAPLLEQLLIQHAALCWLNLSLLELRYWYVMKQSITLAVGLYWEKRLTAAQRRFTRSVETLTRVRKWSRNTSQRYR